ncbi:hypothetical protein Dda_0109 [Drechslerella dactyloides]|uniref:Uncharacterized protein n=1 Tax=Drechslerella dactyloides TaxID=74499 RepID=A0AAD6J7K3_DREDA|nr:hypothetical protein Dda_0109 [Drechslerella dactyloides]
MPLDTWEESLIRDEIERQKQWEEKLAKEAEQKARAAEGGGTFRMAKRGGGGGFSGADRSRGAKRKPRPDTLMFGGAGREAKQAPNAHADDNGNNVSMIKRLWGPGLKAGLGAGIKCKKR